MLREMDLLENKMIREKCIERIDVLNKVGSLLTLPYTELATIQQVAEFYNVPIETIQTIVKRHRNELNTDGYSLILQTRLVKLLNVHDEQLTRKQGKILISVNKDENIIVPNRGLNLFTKRAVLRVGMLLRDSEVAKEVRTRLLDITQDVYERHPEIIQDTLYDMVDEKENLKQIYQEKFDESVKKLNSVCQRVLMMHGEKVDRKIQELDMLIQAQKNINYKISSINSNCFAQNSQAIIELRNQVKQIIFSLKGDPSTAKEDWIDLYKEAYRQFGFNIMMRDKINGSYLNTASYPELLCLLQIAESMENRLVCQL